jgi:multidrug efflux system membrane fusion protein
MSAKSKKKIFLTLTLIAAASAGFFIYSKSYNPAGLNPAAGDPGQAMPVPVTITEKKPLRIWTSYSGRMEAVDFVELRPQVGGRIDDIRFEEGQIVRKGEILLVIDPRPFKANIAEATAALEAAKSRYSLAEKELKRAEDLIKTDALSKRVYDERQNAALVAKNVLDGAQAMLEKARIDLDHAYMKAPISGRISRAEITAGNLVQPGAGAPVLASIVSDQGIYADFEVDEPTYLNTIRTRVSSQEEEKEIPVELALNGSDAAIYKGHIKSFDNRINTSTGTIRARAYFENADGTLLPGMFVTVRLGSPAMDDVILLTEQAVGTDQDRKFVYVVDEDGKVSYREVHLGASIEGKRVISSGLEEGEKVIIDGLVKMQPGMVVAPQVVGSGQEDQAMPSQDIPEVTAVPAVPDAQNLLEFEEDSEPAAEPEKTE